MAEFCRTRPTSVTWSHYKSKEEGEDQESMQSSTTPDPGHYMGKRQKHKKTSQTREPKRSTFSQQVTTRLQLTDKKVLQRQIRNTINGQ